jgi:diguanylate cyclase (GGDEF)-like protein
VRLAIHRNWPVACLIGAVTILCSMLSWFVPLDDALRDMRTQNSSRVPSGTVVFLDIDSASLTSVGVWPWPRSIHAKVLDRLGAMEASDIAFDVDFSVASTEYEDAEFARSLSDAGGYAYLAAFRQLDAPDASENVTLPLPRFAQYAEPLAVNVRMGTGASVRQYPYSMKLSGTSYRSLAAMLAGVVGEEGKDFNIDYSIDARAIDRISIADLLAGNVSPLRIANHQVVIGASALELRDVLVVPKAGAIPGALVHILAAETLKLNRALVPVDQWQFWLTVAVLCAGFGFLGRQILRPAPLVVIALSTIGIEVTAYFLQDRMALLLSTAGLQVCILGLLLAALIDEVVERRRLHALASDARKVAEETIAHLASHDALTGTLTRRELMNRLARPRYEQGATVLAVMLDRFSTVNQALGHSVGDQVLIQTAERLASLGYDEAARLDGAVFAIAIPGTDLWSASVDYRLVRDSLEVPFSVMGHSILLSCKGGVTSTVLSGDSATAGDLISHAQMSLARSADHNSRLLQHDPIHLEQIKRTREIELELRLALSRREVQVAYQAQVDLQTGELVGAEALARWQHVALGNVSPALFVAAAEETGLIIDLGAQVLLMACREAATWPSHLRVAVNISPLQLELDHLVDRVASCLKETGLAPHRLELELTESALLSGGAHTIETLNGLRALGVELALDDFGTGYSSMSYLANLPVTKLKLDKSFIDRLGKDYVTEAIVEAILALCKKLDRRVVAEGVEDRGQAEWLRSRGCDLGQGYLFSKPCTAADMLQVGRSRSIPNDFQATG